MRVYIVVVYDTGCVEKVFASRDLAKTYILSKQTKRHDSKHRVLFAKEVVE